MTALSKLSRMHLKYATCSQLHHSEIDSCFKSFLDSTLKFPISNIKTFLPVLLSGLIMNVKNLNNKATVIDIFKQYLFFVLSGTGYGLGAKLIICLSKIYIGRFDITSYFLPTILPFYLIAQILPKKTLRITSITSFEILMEIILRSKIDPISRLLNRSNIFKTLVFMLCSSYIIRNLQQKKTKTFWFIKPLLTSERDTLKESNSSTAQNSNYNDQEKTYCVHKGKCFKYILDGIKLYGTIGLVLDFLNQILSSKNLEQFMFTFLHDLITLNFQAVKFLITSITIFRTTNCLLNKNNPIGNSLNHNTIAGFLSGIGFFFKPKLILLSYAIASCIEILWKNYKNLKSNCEYEKIFKNINWSKILICLSFPLAIHYYLTDIERVGPVGRKFVEGTTDKIIIRAQANIKKFVTPFQS